MKKIKSFKIKDCEDCFYRQSEIREFCGRHECEWNKPLGIIKQIKEKKTLML